MKFGNNMKRLRVEKGFTLQALSARCGVSASMLSSIEREEKTPTLRIALQIADALNTTLNNLLDQPDLAVSIVRRDERKIIFDPVSGLEGQLLTPDFSSDVIKCLFFRLPPGKNTAVLPPRKTYSKEYLIVHQGQLRIILGNAAYDLQEGDSICYRADIEHQFINPGAGECHYYLVLITPE